MPVKKSPRKASATKPTKIEVVLKIRSAHPSLPAPVAAERVAEAVADLADHLRPKYSGIRVKIERRKTFPVDPITILVTVAIFIGKRIAGKAVDKVTDATVKWAKGKLKGARVTKAEAPADSASKAKESRKE